MRKKIALVLLCLVIGVAAQAQRVVYNVIAQVPFDARTQQYGKMVPKDMRIIKRGDETIYIGAEKYDVVEVVDRKDDINTRYVQYTAIDANDTEVTIKVCHDGTAEHAAMRDYVLIFDNTHIYDWTYYFVELGKE